MSAAASRPQAGEELQALRDELSAVRAREAELRRLLADAHEQLANRDEEIVQDLVQRSQLAQRRVEEMRQTRVWRAASVYWGARDRLRGRVGAARRRQA